jgi:hypothetical protein
MQVFTSRYANRGLAALPAVKVGCTLGKPRFATGYPYVWLPLLAPDRSSFHLEREPFTVVYLEKLDALGLETVLAAIRQASGGADCVLLCFEDLSDPAQWCHRTMLAAWLKERAGIEVEELPEGAGAEEVQATQPVQMSFEGGWNG